MDMDMDMDISWIFFGYGLEIGILGYGLEFFWKWFEFQTISKNSKPYPKNIQEISISISKVCLLSMMYDRSDFSSGK